MSDDPTKSPLNRWSERKARARQEEDALAGEEQPLATVAAEGEAEEDEAEAEADTETETPTIAVEDLPDIDSLDANSDYTVFMGKGVPEGLKNLALRKLWRSDPVFANIDGLVDYGEDFTTSNLMGDAVKTIYKVGKGLISDDEEDAPEDETVEAVEIADENAETAPEEDPEDDEDGDLG